METNLDLIKEIQSQKELIQKLIERINQIEEVISSNNRELLQYDQ